MTNKTLGTYIRSEEKCTIVDTFIEQMMTQKSIALH